MLTSSYRALDELVDRCAGRLEFPVLKQGDAPRERLLERYPTRRGKDRDEYPPAVGRGKGPGLEKGANPRGWRADVAYVPSSENRSHGATLGAKLRRFCTGTRFRYVFY